MTEAAMREVVVASLGLDKVSGAPVVILREKEGDRLLPIWIGPGEASSIAMQMAGVRFARPLTHDLFNALVRGLGCTFVRVLVTKVVDNTFFASLVFSRDGEFFSIDARPSDGIALALRASAPVFAAESLLDATGFEIEDAPPEEAAPGAEGEGGEPAESLRDYLKRLKPEDFGRFDL